LKNDKNTGKEHCAKGYGVKKLSVFGRTLWYTKTCPSISGSGYLNRFQYTDSEREKWSTHLHIYYFN